MRPPQAMLRSLGKDPTETELAEMMAKADGGAHLCVKREPYCRPLFPLAWPRIGFPRSASPLAGFSLGLFYT